MKVVYQNNKKYYLQRTKTDCLLAAAENFVQKPREKFGRLAWFFHGTEKYSQYKNLGKALIKYAGGGQVVAGGGEIDLDKNPAILGSLFTLNNVPVCHSYFWDGERAFCPYRNVFVPLEDLDVSYVVLHKKYKPGPNSKYLARSNIKEYFKFWDKNCSFKKVSKSPAGNHGIKLITLHFGGKSYAGDVNRVLINRAV